jgi:hypothetical protein
MKTKILRNIFLSRGVVFASARLLAAAMTSILVLGILRSAVSSGMNDGVLNFSNTPFVDPQPIITTFDAPGAGTSPGHGTFVFAVDCLNPAGAIATASLDASNVFHGVLRAPDGTMTTFDAQGAGTGLFQGTLRLGINQAGTIEGFYVDPGDVNHGFVRVSDGTITTFDVPGAGTAIRSMRSPDTILTRGMCFTVSCEAPNTLPNNDA